MSLRPCMRAGGVLIYGIPAFRLPKDVVATEINGLRGYGGGFPILNHVGGRTVDIDDLLKKYSAVFHWRWRRSRPFSFGVPGENLVGAFSANEYLTRVNLGRAYNFPGEDTPVCVRQECYSVRRGQRGHGRGQNGSFCAWARKTCISFTAAPARKCRHAARKSSMPRRGGRKVHHAFIACAFQWRRKSPNLKSVTLQKCSLANRMLPADAALCRLKAKFTISIPIWPLSPWAQDPIPFFLDATAQPQAKQMGLY